MIRVWPLIVSLAMMALGCGTQPATPPPAPKKFQVGGVSFPIDADRLKNAQLSYIRDDPPIQWHFKESEFVVETDGQPLPKDLADPLLGAGVTAARVEGKWTFDGVKSELVLTELKSGDQRGLDKAVLPIHPAGMVRANLGERQYNIIRPKQGQ